MKMNTKTKNGTKKKEVDNMINITNTKEAQDNLEISMFKTTQETCKVKEFAEPEHIHQNLELPKFMETK